VSFLDPITSKQHRFYYTISDLILSEAAGGYTLDSTKTYTVKELTTSTSAE